MPTSHVDAIEPARRSPAPLILLGWLCAIAQVLLDADAHRAQIAAPPARIGFDAGLVVISVVSAALVVQTVGRSPQPKVARWTLVGAWMLSVVSLALRYISSSIDPPSRWVFLCEVLASGLLTWCTALQARELRSQRRLQSRFTRDVGVMAFLVIVVRLAIPPTTSLSNQRAAELHALRWLALAAAVALVVDWLRRPRTPWVGSRLRTPGRAGSGVRALWQLCSRRANSAASRFSRVLQPVHGDGGDLPHHRLTEGDRVWYAAMVGIAVGFLALSVNWAFRNGWQLTGDPATVAARAYDVGTRNTPLLGMPAQIGSQHGRQLVTNHPGPANFDIVAPFVRLLGFRDGAFLGSAAGTLAGWLAAVWGAFRAGGRRGTIVVWIAAALVIEFIEKGDVWDPVVLPTVLMMLAAFTLCWAASTGTPSALPWAVAGASISAQTYLPHTLVMAAPTLWAAWIVTSQAKRGPDSASARRAFRWSVAILAVAWIQPAVAVVQSRGEVLKTFWQSIFANTESVGWRGVIGVIPWALRLPPAWDRLEQDASTGYRYYLGSLGASGWIVAAVVAAYWIVTRRSASTAELRLRVLSVLTVMTGCLTLTQLPVDQVRWYYLIWLGMVSFLLWIAIAITATTALMRRRFGMAIAHRPHVKAALFAVAAVVVLTSSLVSTAALRPGKRARALIDRAAEVIAGPALATTRSAPRVLVLRLENTPEPVADSLIGALIVGGRNVNVESAIADYFGTRREARSNWNGMVLALVDGAARVRPRNARVIARADPPGWSQHRFDLDAERIRDWAVAHGPIRLSSPTTSVLASFVDGWTSDLTCGDLRKIEEGATPASALPAGAIARLYANGAITSPVLPPSLARLVTSVLNTTPIELWRFDRLSFSHPASSQQTLRSGQQCE